jgi:hypothetical protein
MAAFVSNNSALCFIKLAVYTSALLFIMVAYPNLLCLAAEVKSRSISGGIIISSINTFSIEIPGGIFF